MKFTVEKELFEKLPDACFGIVSAKGVDNSTAHIEIERMLDENAASAAMRFSGVRVKDAPEILAYREAFRTLGINPNKYLCSAEALFTRIAKGKGMPHINPIVDLGNAVSLKYTLPIGAHDLSGGDDCICIRTARQGDTFLPFGSCVEEAPDEGEFVYAVGSSVRTRRWTWRQSEYGKITANSSEIFFPIDGFTDINYSKVIEARNELKMHLSQIFNCEVKVGFADAAHPTVEL